MFWYLFLKDFIIQQVAKDVIQEFAADGVKYLELRSTPREVTETGNRNP